MREVPEPPANTPPGFRMNRTVAFKTMIPPHSNWSLPYDIRLHCKNTTDITVFLAVSYSVEAALGLLGNVCWMGILTRQKEKAGASNVLILNLIASDLLMCVFCLPFTVVTVLSHFWVFGEAMCKTTTFLQCTSITVSILSLVLIAVERHQLIINPTGWRPALSHAYRGVAATWVFASLLSLPFLTNSSLSDGVFRRPGGPVESDLAKPVCTWAWSSEKSRLTYTTALLLLQYCIPLAVILLCYLRIYLCLRKRRGMFEKRERGYRGNPLRRINLILASMVAAFATCWLPLHVFNGVEDWDYRLIPYCLYDLIFSLCHLAGMVSVCVNPVIYGVLNKNIKKEVKDLVLSCRCRSSEPEYEHPPRQSTQLEASKDSLGLSQQQTLI